MHWSSAPSPNLRVVAGALPPSKLAKLARIVEVGEDMDISVELIRKKDFSRLFQFDALYLQGRQICTRVPSSMTPLFGSLKNSTALPEFRLMAANRRSRQWAIPDPSVGMTVSRLTK